LAAQKLKILAILDNFANISGLEQDIVDRKKELKTLIIP